MAFPASICPRSANVWHEIGFSTCFGDMLFGFGGNMLALFLIAILVFWCTNPKVNQVASTCILYKQKCCLLGLCSLEFFLSLSCILFLLKQKDRGQAVMYCQWLYNCSQTISWIAIALILNSRLSNVLCNRMLCFWCIVKPVMELPQFYAAVCSSEVLHALKDGCSILAAIIFGIILSITTIGNRPKRRNAGLLGEALISSDDPEEILQIDGDFQDLSYWHLVTFRFVNPMIQFGSTKQLEFGNLLQLPVELNPFSCQDALWQSWICEQRKHSADASLFRAICLAYGWLYLKIGVLKVLNDSVGFLGPLLLNKLIWYLQEGSTKLDGFAYASLLGLSFVSKSFLDTQYSFQLAKLRLRLRASIMAIIYQKCLTMTVTERSNFSEGEIQTLMSIDADRIGNLCNSFHELWSLPVQIGVALFLLYTQVKVAFVSGIGITILLIPVNRWIAGLIANATEAMMKQKDERIRRAGELLTHIRTLKMFSWELLFADRLMVVRELEVKHLSTRKYLDAWCVFFWATTPTLFSLFTFGLFTLLGHPLNAATVFTCVALFNVLISPLNSFPWVINGIIDAVISTRRLTRLLCCSSAIPQQTIQSFGHFEREVRSCTYPHGNQQNNIHDSMAVVINDANCVWSNKKSAKDIIVLNHISLEIPCGFLVAIVGEVGSGKSSLLNAILGEMQLVHGSICTHGTIAYASQVPWILSGSIQDNILFGNRYIAQRYKDVVCACALDFDVSLMVGGDHAHVGEKGVKLSGGQRARLALARAIYHDHDIYLLDDVLSAVDTQVASWIIQNAILDPLMNHKTRILCTHNPQIISSADMVIVMDGGHVKWSGSSAEFNLSTFSTLCLTHSNILSPQSINQQTSTVTEGNTKQLLGLEIMAEPLEDVKEMVEEEIRKVGKVEFSVYKSYAKFASLPVALVICSSAFLMQASRNGNDFWLTHWVDTYSWSHHSNPSVHFYLSVLCIFAAVNSLLTLVRAFSFSYGGLRATMQVHNKLLKKLINAPICFFEQNPTGRILNRFSSDQYAIDDSLPFILNILLANFFSLLGVAIVLSYVQIFFIFLLLPFCYIYSKLQFYYRCTSRELRRLDSVSRSPIYASFTEALEGASTIRAFSAEERFIAQFSELIMVYQKTSYSEVAASLWLSLRLQLLAAFVISFIAIMAVLGHCGGLPFNLGTPGLVGLALSYAAPVVTLLSGFLSSFTETEKEMVSVERTLQYMDVIEEAQDGMVMDADWPKDGHIEFDRVTLRYMPSLPPALQNVSFSVPAGKQVGIVGRTGAGKSSVLNALFRLNPICEGRILLDGTDLASLAVRTIRSHLAVVPQSPFLFEGTLRENLDPFKVANDSDIWNVLEKCYMKEDIEAAGGLHIQIKEAGASLSLGQRQLICLARALIKSSKVLCLDECTANMDFQTASRLQNTISHECKGITVLTIAHRISTILNMDNVLIFDQGILVEQGNPRFLLQDELSRFSSFAKASTL